MKTIVGLFLLIGLSVVLTAVAEERPPEITAKVLAVRSDAGLVMIGVGSTNSVRPGYQFIISKDGKNKVNVQPQELQPEYWSPPRSLDQKPDTLKPATKV